MTIYRFVKNLQFVLLSFVVLLLILLSMFLQAVQVKKKGGGEAPKVSSGFMLVFIFSLSEWRKKQTRKYTAYF